VSVFEEGRSGSPCSDPSAEPGRQVPQTFKTLNSMHGRGVFPDRSLDAIRFGLFETTRDYDGDSWSRDVLEPWVAENRATVAALRQVGRPEMSGVVLDAADSWALYGLSRVVDWLIRSHQPATPEAGSAAVDGPLPRRAYQEFVAAIGGTFPDLGRFHPFLHEIVAVEPAANPAQPPILTARWWPGCFIGSLLLCRSGVTVRAGSDHLDPIVATTSTMYWAWTRRYRPAADLSHGWGWNSSWATDFRRDYWLPGKLLYNVDAMLDPKPEHPGGLPFNRDVELVRHRCHLLAEPDDEVWVWAGHHTELTPFTMSIS
jgi:hypothetical protein